MRLRGAVVAALCGGVLWTACATGCGGQIEGGCQGGDFPALVECLDRCGGAIVTTICAPATCPRGTVSASTCRDDPAPVDAGPRPLDASRAPDATPDAAACVGPYHAPTPNGGCVWSCATGTQPDPVSNECVCQPGKTETGVDKFGRRVCA